MEARELAKRFGDTIRRLRSEAGWSQEEFALRCGLHRTYIGSIERGEKNVTLQTAYKLSKALGLSLSSLISELDADRKS